jgi:hypothetical protein
MPLTQVDAGVIIARYEDDGVIAIASLAGGHDTERHNWMSYMRNDADGLSFYRLKISKQRPQILVSDINCVTIIFLEFRQIIP